LCGGLFVLFGINNFLHYYLSFFVGGQVIAEKKNNSFVSICGTLLKRHGLSRLRRDYIRASFGLNKLAP
jgi:hypothetical protein